MSYTIYKSDGTVQTTISDGFLDTSTSLKLPGPNYVGYGRYLNENLLYLLENFAANTAPVGTNTEGQLWFDKFNKILKVFTSDAGYVPVSGVTNSGTQPIAAKDGDMWFNTSTNQIYLYNNSKWEFIGPQYTREQGVSGLLPTTVGDGSTSSLTHRIFKIQFGNVTYGTFSADGPFLPSPAMDGFSTIYPGLTLNSNIANNGTRLNSNLLGNVAGSLLGDVYTKDGVTRVLQVGTGLNDTAYYGDIYANGIKILDSGTTGTDASFVGSVTGNVNGNLTSINAAITNLTTTNLQTGNVAITGGFIKSVSGVYAQEAYFNNISSSNILVSGGTLNVSRLTADSVQLGNLNTGNAVISGGYISRVANITAGNSNITNSTVTTEVATNFSSGNVAIAGGYLTNLSNVYATLGVINNFSSANAVITAGQLSGVSITATQITTPTIAATVANITTANITTAVITGGNISRVSLTQTVATTQPYNDNTANVATTAFVQSVVPAGVIWMWNNTTNTIPTGWQLCDGSNGTPNLTDKFIVGAGSSYTVGATGGNNNVTLSTTQLPPHIHPITIVANTNPGGTHTHSATSTVADSGHSHGTNGSVITTAGAAYTGPYTVATGWGGATINASTTGIGVSTSVVAASNHIHSMNISDTTGTTGGGQPHENRPPYYALCYIQKMY